MNLWVHTQQDMDERTRLADKEYLNYIRNQRDKLNPLYQRFSIPPPVLPYTHVNFDEQIEALLESQPPVISFVMGVPSPAIISEAHRRGIYIIASCTTIQEAVVLEKAGVDAIVASGSDAGGHRGSFLKPPEQSYTGTLSLVPAVADAVNIPVIAAGGISDSRGVIAALVLGADAVQIGTALLVADESAAPEVHKQALVDPGRNQTTMLTRAWSGRVARGQPNNFIRDMESRAGDILPYPAQNYLTSSLRKAAATEGDPEHLALWSGQGAPLVRRASAKAILDGLLNGCNRIYNKFRAEH